MIKNHDLVDIDDLDYQRETERAFLTHNHRGEAQWLPKSLVEYDKDSKTFTMPEWLALEKGLI